MANDTKPERLEVVPVALFVYKRASELIRTLDGLRGNDIPLLVVYSDGPKSSEDAAAVGEVRKVIRRIDWCETRVFERPQNLGLGRSLRAGITEILEGYDRIIVFEDDIVCIPGTYKYLCDALHHFDTCDQVMSVAAWTYPSLRPGVPEHEGYFDGRFACWGWGTWKRAWQGMDVDAETLLKECRRQRKNVDRHGSDLAPSAEQELAKNTWAIRFTLLHILRGGLCFHPPYSLVQNIGFGPEASNTQNTSVWTNVAVSAPGAPVFSAPPRPVAETDGVAELWRKALGVPERRSLGMRLRVAKWRLQLQFQTAMKRHLHKNDKAGA